jgi:hypothetical protein
MIVSNRFQVVSAGRIPADPVVPHRQVLNPQETVKGQQKSPRTWCGG